MRIIWNHLSRNENDVAVLLDRDGWEEEFLDLSERKMCLAQSRSSIALNTQTVSPLLMLSAL